MDANLLTAGIATVVTAFLTLLFAQLWHRSRSAERGQVLRVELIQAQERLQARSAELERVQEELEDAEEQVQQLSHQTQVLQREASQWQAQAEAQQSQLERAEHDRSQLQRELDQQRRAATDWQTRLMERETELRQERSHHEEKLHLLSEAREQMSQEFKILAGQILDENGQKFAEQNRQQIDQILLPLNTQLKDFRQKVEEAYDKESQQRFSLANEIKRLQALNERISEDAINLTNALKGENKIQGNWGEVILERLLERSGLVRGREYEVQASFKDSEGQRFQPDVLIHLPESKQIVVDSKVSLAAFTDYCSTDSDEARERHLRMHIGSIRGHIRGLGKKQYQDLKGLTSLDFVLLFIPVEGAFSLAVQADGELFNEAFEQNIVIVSPSTLLATLRTIHNIWRYEYQSRNAQEIARQAGNLYDKFVAFVADLEEVGVRLETAHKAWEGARNKLVVGKGNLVRRAESLRALGARTSKRLDGDLLAKASDEETPEPESAESD